MEGEQDLVLEDLCSSGDFVADTDFWPEQTKYEATDICIFDPQKCQFYVVQPNGLTL